MALLFPLREQVINRMSRIAAVVEDDNDEPASAW